MPTTTIFADNTTNHQVKSESATYENAREASGDAVLVLQVGTPAIVGQNWDSINSVFEVSEVFLTFDTSSLVGSVVSAEFLVRAAGGGGSFTLEMRLQDWGGTLETSDFVPGSSLAGTTLLATLSAVGWPVSSTWLTFTEVALGANINQAGATRVVVSIDKVRLGTSPGTGSDNVNFTSPTGSGTTNDPRIAVSTSTASTDDILNPDTDVAVNSWTTDTGATTDLYTAIDELTASDTDYIQSPAGPTTAQYYETALETKADPLSSSGHIVHYRYQKNVAGGNVGLTVGLLSGFTELLTANQAGVETDTTGWAASPGTITRSTALFHTGAASVEVVGPGVGGNLFTPAGTSGFAVTPGTIYTLTGYARAVVLGRAGSTAQFIWYDGAGAQLSTSNGTWTDTTTDWTQFNVVGTAPGSAAFGAIKFAIPITSGGEAHYFDTMSVSTPFVVDSWTHTNIPNSWTQQDQTLTAPQADSITDYSDLRLRFTPDMVTTDQTVPVPTKVADRASANSNSAVTTVDLVLTSLTVGNYLIVRSAADNSGGGGGARSFTVSNLVGTAMGTHTEYQENKDPGAASAGTTINVSIIKIAATLGTIRLTYGGSVVQACVAEEWSGIDPTTPVVGTPFANTATGTTHPGTDSLTDTSVALGNVAYAVIAVEGPTSDVYTQDADTVNGSWVSLTKLGTSNATADLNQTTYGGYKTVTATGAQSYHATTPATRDSAGIIFELAAAPAPAPTIRAQVSWANFELPEAQAPTSVARSLAANVGSSLATTGAISFGAGDL